MKKFLEWSIGCLNQAGFNHPRLEAEVLLAGALKLCRKEIYLNPERILSEDEKLISCGLIKRRILREPVAHILGYKEFWSLNFKTTPDVLIPRPETETLIETLFSLNNENRTGQPKGLLDIGTGSGIIAVVAAKEFSDFQVMATDHSAKALSVAKINAKSHGVANKVDFEQSDLFAELPKVLYDFVVSNPPYIETRRLNSLMQDVCGYEPRPALDGGVDGLDFYRRIIPSALDYLKEGGCLILEIGETQTKAVRHLLSSIKSYQKIKVIQDGSGYDRVVSAIKKTNG